MSKFVKGDVIGPYRVLGELGSGGFGAVVQVKHRKSGDETALKYCTSTDPDLRRRFAREVRGQQRVTHENVMEILSGDLDYDPPYFVMPIAVASLDKEIFALAHDHDRALDAFLQICTGVSAIHASAGPHRDLKPHNALRMPDGRIVVSDFGLVKIDPRDTTVLTQTYEIVGTPWYMAPEQRLPGGSRDADVRVDVYALGATLFHMLTGREPAVLDTSGLPPLLARIVKRATANVPAERHQTVDELMKAVQRYVAMVNSPKDPLGDFIDLFDRVNTKHEAERKFVRKHLGDLLAAIRPLLPDPGVLLEQFDRIPIELLEAAAERLPDELIDALGAYVEALDRDVSGRGFKYAERVAARMQRVRGNAERASLKALAIRATLVAAVDLHRFAAMDAFVEMLSHVSDDDEAAAVAEVLRDEQVRFRLLAHRVKKAALHHLLREVVREAENRDAHSSGASSSGTY